MIKAGTIMKKRCKQTSIKKNRVNSLESNQTINLILSFTAITKTVQEV